MMMRETAFGLFEPQTAAADGNGRGALLPAFVLANVESVETTLGRQPCA